jgi:beta-glucanase (GH16 family)
VSGGGDPNDSKGEIDVMELPGGGPWYSASTAAIWYTYDPPVKRDYRYDFPGATYPGDGYHVYAMEWEPGQIRFYVDGQQVWQTVTPVNTSWFNDVFNEHARYHLRLTFHVGGWPGEPDAATAFPADFEVDYVRVYQR